MAFQEDLRWVVDHIASEAERTAANHRGKVSGAQNADGTWPVKVNGSDDKINLPSNEEISDGDSLTLGHTDGQWEILYRSAYVFGRP